MHLHMERMPRIDPGVMARAMQAMYGLEGFVAQSGLEKSLLDLVKPRASRLNGCAYCIDMHTKEARARDESEQRLSLLDAWRESPFSSDRERAALLWTEALTLVADEHVPDAVYDEARQSFTDDKLASLTMAIVAIGAWERPTASSASSSWA